MTLSQEIIFYFIIIPLFSFLIYLVIKSYIENQKAFKKQIWNLRKEFRNKNLEYEKQDFLENLKSDPFIKVNRSTKIA